MNKKILVAMMALNLAKASFSQIPHYVTQDGLVAFWNFNNNVTDATGNSTSTNVGCAFSTDYEGNSNSAISMTGTIADYQFVDVVNDDMPLGNTARTVSMWYYTGQFTTDCYNFLISWGAAGSDPGTESEAFGVVMGNDGSTFGVWSGWNDLNLTYSFSSNSWYHLAITVDEVGHCVFYVDGAQSGTGNLAVPLATVSNSSMVRIGQSTHLDPTPQFVGLVEGKIDELGVWNRVLTACEIEAMYTNFNYTISQTSNTLTVAESGLSYQWLQCNGGTYVEISGATGQSFDPTQTGSYAVVLDDGGGCPDTSACISFGFAGFDQMQADANVQVFPNPANEKFYLSSMTNTPAFLFDQTGKLVLSFHTNTEVDIRELAPGIYFIQTSEAENIKLVID